MSKIIRQDTNGVKPLLAVGELGYDNYLSGGDIGRVYVGTGSSNIAQAKKSEVVTVDGKVDAHVARIDNPHGVTKTQVGLNNVDNTADSAKVVASAGKWTTARTLSLTGDITGSVSIDGSGNASIVTTVAASSVALGTDTTGNYVAGTTAGAGVTVSGTPGEGWSPTIALTDVGTVGTYTKVTTNSKGQITVGDTLVAADIPNLDASKITAGTLPVLRGGTGVTTVTGTGSVVLNTSPALVTPDIGIATGTSFNSITGLASVNPIIAGVAAVGTSTLTARQDHVHPVQTSVSGNAGTATKLATARTINGVSFDGSANITISDSTAVKLTENQTIDGVKTFTSSPIVPTPTAGTQATNKAYVDDKYSGFKNYIINGRFDVWQRGNSVNIAGGEVRCTDMYIAYSAATTPTASRDSGVAGFYSSLKISGANSTSNNHIIHRIEAVNSISMGVGDNTKITFSLWLKADVNSTVIVAIRVPNTTDTWSSYTIPKISNEIHITTSWDRYSVTFDLDFVYWGGIALDVHTITAQTSLWTTGWQLEQGSVATPFEYRPIGLELSLCQRYLPHFNTGLSCFGQAYGGNLAGYTVKLPVSTRVAPTGIVSIGGFNISRGDGGYTSVSSFSFVTSSKETVSFNAGLGVSFLTSGQASYLVSTGGILYFTGCEL